MADDNKRGRAKNEEKLVIRDPAIEPYEIRVDSNNYVVIDTDKSMANSPQGYFNDVGTAIRFIVKLQIKHKKNTYTLTQYLKEYNDCVDRLQQITNQFP
jgi:hypothetical protein